MDEKAASAELSRAIQDFQNGNHQRAILQLTQIISFTPQDWTARFYLAMAYFAIEDTKQGLLQFYKIYVHCPDEKLRDRAKAVLPAKVVQNVDRDRSGESFDWIN